MGLHLPENHIRTVCKKGHGEDTCQFLTYLSGEAEWRCAKTAEAWVIPVWQAMRKQHTVVLKGNHCSGPPDFQPIDSAA
jgi:hypothetical protein